MACFQTVGTRISTVSLLIQKKLLLTYSRFFFREPYLLLSNIQLWISLNMCWFHFFFSISVAVVVAFILCWAPFHAQRLVAIYGSGTDHLDIYVVMTYISGILYYLSTCINPLLYNIMSNKFRQAFKVNPYGIVRYICYTFIQLYIILLQNTIYYIFTAFYFLFLALFIIKQNIFLFYLYFYFFFYFQLYVIFFIYCSFSSRHIASRCNNTFLGILYKTLHFSINSIE